MFCLLNKRKRRRARIDESIPVADMRYVVIDTELTGLDEKRDSIVSIGAIKMAGGKIELQDTFYRLVNPETALTAKSVIIHQITPSEVEKKPAIEQVLAEFLQFCGNDVVIGHCVSIDLSFIDRETKKTSSGTMQNPVLDTSAIYQWIQRRYSSEKALPGSFSDSGLYEIAQYFGIPVNGAHNALMDAFITAQVFQRFLPMLIKGGIERIGDLLILGNPSKGGDRSGAVREMYSL